jgi:DNA-binding phage protein
MLLNDISEFDILKLYDIAPRLQRTNYGGAFFKKAMKYAHDNPGIYNLLLLWDESEPADKEAIVAEIQDLIDDEEQNFEEAMKIRFDDLETISSNISTFKNTLLMRVNKDLGGITKLAERTGIPQPSLSRFFNSVSMPRKSTLLKIAEALNLTQLEIARF